MGGGADAVEVAVVEAVQAGGEPFVALVAEHELQDAGEVVEVLAGMPDIDDLGGLGELAGGDVPDPGGAVADDVSWRMWCAPRRMPSASTRSANVAAR
jgi:hypothetical protein